LIIWQWLTFWANRLLFAVAAAIDTACRDHAHSSLRSFITRQKYPLQTCSRSRFASDTSSRSRAVWRFIYVANILKKKNRRWWWWYDNSAGGVVYFKYYGHRKIWIEKQIEKTLFYIDITAVERFLHAIFPQRF